MPIAAITKLAYRSVSGLFKSLTEEVTKGSRKPLELKPVGSRLEFRLVVFKRDRLPQETPMINDKLRQLAKIW